MTYSSNATGLLLAAGLGTRFDPSGARNKLLAPLPDGAPVVLQSARRLLSVTAEVVAVVRPGAEKLARVLSDAGCNVVVSEDAERGMGATLAAAVRATSNCSGWIVALGDMPWIEPATIEAVARSLDAGAELVAPCYRGTRGHPVGFGGAHRDALASLDGDAGARGILARATPLVIDVDDPNVLRDVDRPSDLQ
ncbi:MULTISPECIES: nucleotidyltransferase family protein [unclassified Caballeronia]|uniref:nucleotidyltransferase family protein n=1 Tax=unclassified Caballeronia TaxID=2646786 RepID=UPI0028644774|nr:MULTISPECIES: nucleotidyltransferase family protein [unclassified Caballeronia]MDR5739838.1 nucleotidyltransferase family protein [Caballeronia sp. LZ016]MDR5808303.1 nucleotidyltransferase family protein [Caballeronia sp. LZ019]